MVLVTVAMLLLVPAVLELGHVTQRANAIREDVEMVRARLAAETALLQYREGSDLPTRRSIAGLSVDLDRDADQFLISMSSAAHPFESFARRLTGAAPLAFSHARVATDPLTLKAMGGGYHESVTEWPMPSTGGLAAACRVSEMRGFHRDPEIALHYLTAGTDRPDFVWRSGEGLAHSTSSAILVVPGNLWIEAGSRPLECTLQSDLVLIVAGNLHLLRSLRIHGPGRLLLVSDAGDAPVVFSDQDGGGGWSAGDLLRTGDAFSGPAEGSGSVYLGLPGVATNIVCDAGILVGGELHLAGIATVHGPLLLRHGVTKLASPATKQHQQISLRPPGPEQWTYRLGRDRIPGFAVSGPPRPGRLEFRLR
ncbi:MAG: hypothetical protein ACI9S9_001733 [Planctomycetota bacterium]|jgi:hypothetical protein